MNVHQLQLTYDAAEDRILFRATFLDDSGILQEIRAWLTRRIVRNLWPGIVRTFETLFSSDCYRPLYLAFVSALAYLFCPGTRQLIRNRVYAGAIARFLQAFARCSAFRAMGNRTGIAGRSRGAATAV